MEELTAKCWTMTPLVVRRGPLCRPQSTGQLVGKRGGGLGPPLPGGRPSTSSVLSVGSRTSEAFSVAAHEELRATKARRERQRLSVPRAAPRTSATVGVEAFEALQSITTSASVEPSGAIVARTPSREANLGAAWRSFADGDATQRSFPVRSQSHPSLAMGPSSGEQQCPETARPSSSPAMSFTGGTARSYVPYISPEKLETLTVDKAQQRAHPPQLREHVQLSKLLKSGDYRRCIALVTDCLKQGNNTSTDESAEDIALRMAQLEYSLVGPIEDRDVRQVLLLWVLGASLEAVGEVRSAILVFSKCLSLDPTNPVHAYHRGVCLLRAKSPKTAYLDFDLAVELCTKRDVRPPLAFYANRAQAGAVQSVRGAEVWADFEFVRQCCHAPDLPLIMIAKRAESWEDVHDSIARPVPADGDHRHWVSVLVSRCCGQPEEVVSDVESVSFIRFLRSLPSMSSMTAAVVIRRISEFSTRQIPEGRLILPENKWYCVLDGSIHVVRFCRPAPPGELGKMLAKKRGWNEARAEDEDSDPLSMPRTLREIPGLEVLEKLSENSTFRVGDTFGPLGDGWLVAGQGGVELLCLGMKVLKKFERLSGSLGQVESDLKIIAQAPLFKAVPTHVLLTMVSEIFELRRACWREDPLSSWPGLVVIRSGQLQLWTDARPSSPGAAALRPGSASAAPEGKEELCVVGPGDVIGVEKLLGGAPSITFNGSAVLSHWLEAWVLTPERHGDAEDIGVFAHMQEFRYAERRKLQERANFTCAWTRRRPRALALAKMAQRTIDYAAHGEMEPPPRICGGHQSYGGRGF
mmetsp:Transcript_106756/g.300075  ORF Transcript_106756/g.300075 Transcript_106756/m.300075 type:complete len:807 (-) Transcript_106756:114-2534(-)